MQRSDTSYVTLSGGIMYENTSDKRHTTTKRTAISCHAIENTVLVVNIIGATYTKCSMGRFGVTPFLYSDWLCFFMAHIITILTNQCELKNNRCGQCCILMVKKVSSDCTFFFIITNGRFL